MKLAKILNDLLFGKPSAKEIAKQDLEEAKRQHLKSMSAAEYHTRMADYYSQTINRLTKYVSQQQ